MAVRPKTATWTSRCLLSVALLFGIVLMHALGHPGEHVTDDSHATHATHATHTDHVMAAASAEHQALAPTPHSTHPAPAHGAGAAAVCLAVLGVGVGAALLARAIGRRTPGRDMPPPTARQAYALRAIPPPAPPGSLLTRLSLLRI